MKTRVTILTALLVVLVALLVHYRPAAWSAGGKNVVFTVQDPGARGPRGIVRRPEAMSLAELRERMARGYRLRPDARFLRAAVDLRRFFRNDSVAAETLAARVVFVPADPPVAVPAANGAPVPTGNWLITVGDDTLGRVTEWPAFDDLAAVLDSYAIVLASERPDFLSRSPRPARDVAAATDRLRPADALRIADRHWTVGFEDAGLLRDAVRALVAMTIETNDLTGVADAIPARALAMLSACQALGGRNLERERCLLANAMGYTAYARERAEGLALSDPARAFVLREDAALSSLASGPGGSTEARYFRLLRLAQRRDLDGWLEASARDFGGARASASIPVLASGLDISRFDSRVSIAEALVRATGRELGVPARDASLLDLLLNGPSLRQRTDGFERALDDAAARSAGPFLDTLVCKAYYRAAFYAASYQIGSHYMNSLSSIAATKWFASEVRAKRPGPGQEFSEWYAHLALAKSGKASVEILSGDLVRVPSFGARLLDDTMDELVPYLALGDPALRAHTRTMASRLDSRPEHAALLGFLLLKNLYALGPAEDWIGYAALTGGDGAPHMKAFWAGYTGQFETALEMTTRDEIAPRELAFTLRVLEETGGPPADVDRAYERAIAAHPDDWKIMNGYADYLEKRKEYARARDVLQAWLARAPASADALEPIVAYASLARMYLKLGRAEEGLAIIDRLDQTQQFGAMKSRALLLDALGRRGEAESLARAAFRRYPDGMNSRMLLVEILWRHRKYSPAARLLMPNRYPITAAEWRVTIAKAFVEVFHDHPREGGQAFQALTRVVPMDDATLGRLATAAEEQGYPELAFEVYSRLKVGGAELIQVNVEAYRCLRKWRGKPYAMDWLRKRMNADDGPLVACFAWQFAEYDLLWELGDLKGIDGEYQWLLRAAASTAMGPERDPRRGRLERHFERPRGGHYSVAARYLLGRASEADVLAETVTPKRRCELYYFLGLKAHREGRYRDAADWYTLSVDTGLITNGELRWAFYQLIQWTARLKSLERIQEEDARTPLANVIQAS